MSNTAELLSDVEARVKIENAMRINYSDEQWEVVKDSGRPASVVSSAGSGKTTVLIARLLYKELVFGIKPYRMLVITFNKKASVEIEERFYLARKRLGLANFSPSFHTFHAFFLRLLRSDEKYEDTMVTSSGKYFFVLADMVKTHQSLKSNIDVVKEILSTRSYGINNKKDYMTHNEFGNLGRDVIIRYEELMRENNEMDFDDMLLLLYREMFEHHNQDIIDTFKESYDLVLIDEFQDISGIQYDIVEELMTSIGMDNLTVIGDADQTIYEFRGSNPKYIVQFGSMLPSAKTHFLSVNYRCPQKILEFIAPSIYRNEKRIDIALQSSGEGGEVKFLGVKEDEPLVEQIERDYRDNKEVAILVRNNHQKTIISDRLVRRGIAVDMGTSSYTIKNNQVFKRLSMIVDMIRESDNQGFIKYHWIYKASRSQLPAMKARYRGSDELWVEDVLESDMWGIPDRIKRVIRTMLQEDQADKLYKHAMDFYYESFRSGARKGFYNIDLIDDYYNYIVNDIAVGKSYIEFKSRIEHYQQLIDRNLGNRKAVQLATMHTVKGLEFDTVIVYDPSDTEMFPEFRSVWEIVARQKGVTEKEVKKQVFRNNADYLSMVSNAHNGINKDIMTASEVQDRVEAERRLFYVACTRAKETLVLATDIERRSTLILEALAHRGTVEIPVVKAEAFVERTLESVEEDAIKQREQRLAVERLREEERRSRMEKRMRGLSDLESLLGNKQVAELDKTMSLDSMGEILNMGDGE